MSQTSFPPIADRPWLVSYGRRKARKLTPNKSILMEELLPQIEVRLQADGIHDANLPTALVAQYPHIWLEIGFGGGEHLAEQAARNPGVLCIGCEPFIDGVAKLVENVGRHQLKNVRILPEDARLLLDALPDGSLDRVFILFPDPWPKIRHQKRRIVSQEMLGILHRVLKAGGELRLATDHVDYAKWMLEHIGQFPGFVWQSGRERDVKTAPEDWVPTRYEQKTRAQGREPVYYLLCKR